MPLPSVTQHVHLQATRGGKGTGALVTMKGPEIDGSTEQNMLTV